MPSTRPSRPRFAEAVLRRALSLRAGSALLILAACGPERIVETAPTEAVPRPDLRTQAFTLTIDTRSGRVDVAPPSRAIATVPGLALSLLGGEAIALATGPCAFSAIPDRSSKRCTIELSIRNRLQAADLVTPTTFPRPPQGTNGILVFPFTATTPGGADVLPSPDWDLGPANFFNDNSCSGSGKTDCFRYELFPSPLYAGESSPTRQVGFDIPASVSSVTLYLVIAADLRDNPVRTATLPAVQQLCGMVDFLQDPPAVVMNYPNDQFLYVDGARIVFCSFPNILPAGARIRDASLRLFVWGAPFGPVLVQRVNWGSTLEPTDVLLPTLNSAEGPVIEDASYAEAVYKWYVARGARAGVQGAVDEQQSYIQYRVIPDPSSSTGGVYFFGANAATTRRPQLVVQYTLP